MTLKGKTAIVTGASRGIGKAIALELAKQGADLAIVATKVENAAPTAAEAAKLGVKAKAYGVSVADPGAVNACVEQVMAEFGSVGILVNNAGVTRDNILMRMSDAEWQEVIDVNLKGAFNFLRAVTRPMMKAKWGRVINITSVSGITGNPGQVNYSASKAGLIGMTRSAALELASRNITINAVAPGFIETDMTKEFEAQKDKICEKIPAGRFGQPADIASAVAYLASDGAAYVTGQVLIVDGGLSM